MKNCKQCLHYKAALDEMPSDVEIIGKEVVEEDICMIFPDGIPEPIASDKEDCEHKISD
jgi:hypothetical protein